VAAVTVNVLGRSPRGQQWCRATVYASLTFVIGGPQGVTVVRQARLRTFQVCPKWRTPARQAPDVSKPPAPGGSYML
jgi:hypothetical protein